MDQLFTESNKRSYSKGQILLYQGESSNNLFQIKSGYVKVYDVTAHGTEKLILILGPDDVFPLIWNFDGDEDMHYFYETFTDAELSVADRSGLLELIEKDHELTKHLLDYFVKRSQQLLSRIDCIEATSAKHKIAQVYEYLADSLGTEVVKDAFKLDIPITQQSIADMAGITRETASLHINDLIDEGMISTANHTLLIHRDKIEEFLAQES